MSRFVKRIRKRERVNNNGSWERIESHSMWRGLKEVLKKKLGLC